MFDRKIIINFIYMILLAFIIVISITVIIVFTIKPFNDDNCKTYSGYNLTINKASMRSNEAPVSSAPWSGSGKKILLIGDSNISHTEVEFKQVMKKHFGDNVTIKTLATGGTPSGWWVNIFREVDTSGTYDDKFDYLKTEWRNNVVKQELKDDIENTDFIVLSIGGNDSRFFLPNYWITNKNPDILVKELIDEQKSNTKEIIQIINKWNSNVKILLGLYTEFGGFQREECRLQNDIYNNICGLITECREYNGSLLNYLTYKRNKEIDIEMTKIFPNVTSFDFQGVLQEGCGWTTTGNVIRNLGAPNKYWKTDCMHANTQGAYQMYEKLVKIYWDKEL